MANPSELSLIGASFSASTADSYPLVVYVRSDWGQALSKRKHTVELKCEQHEDSSNVLGVLRRDATDGKYILHNTFRFPVHSHLTERTVDLLADRKLM